MIAKDINPFIRWAFILSKTPLDKLVTCADCRLFYVINGSGKLFLGKSCLDVKKDFLFLWESGTEYRWEFSKNNNVDLAIINFDYTQKFRHITKQLDIILSESDMPKNILKSDEFEDIYQLNSPICINNAHIFKKSVLEIIENFESAALFSKELSEANLKHLILKIAQHITVSSISQTKLYPILEYIHSNYNTDISNTELGAIINYHPHHVNLLMKKYTGTTLHSYITQYRMNEALKMLTNSTKTIEAIAAETGYKNPSHFYKIFKQTYGLSPSEYRKASIII